LKNECELDIFYYGLFYDVEDVASVLNIFDQVDLF